MVYHLGRLLDHVHIHVKDLSASKRFYAAILAPFNLAHALIASDDYFHIDELWIDQAVGPTSKVHLAFQARSEAMVDAFYKAALEAGGKDNGPPGFRSYHPNYYAAFVNDLDGNNLEAVYHGASERSAESVVFSPLSGEYK